jgi:hypothetical protein
MDKPYDNLGCTLFIQIPLGVFLSIVVTNFFFINPLFATAAYALAYSPFITVFGAVVYLAVLALLMFLVQFNLIEAQWSERKNKGNIIAILLLLLPPVIGFFLQIAHIGLCYSLMILAWSYLVVNRKAITRSRQKSKNNL